MELGKGPFAFVRVVTVALFVDEITLWAHAGKGGDGAVYFRREKFVPRGGPAGGDGGSGGDVCLVASHRVNTLSHLRFRRNLKAKNGAPGGKNQMHGRGGASIEVEVPVGTLVYGQDDDGLLGDLVSDGQRLIVARGGKGGKGNARFATATHRSPDFAEKGEAGESIALRLEMKMLADVGLLGFPSVGKSTLIRAVSNAKPKVAAYPFTTLTPNLGVVVWRDEVDFVVADIPGLIVGASAGRGLGHDFLRHLERTALLLHIIEVTEELEGVESERDPIGDFERLNAELTAYAEDLAQRPQVVVLNKVDLTHVRARSEGLAQYFGDAGYPFAAVSAATGEGMDALLALIVGQLAEVRRDAEAAPQS